MNRGNGLEPVPFIQQIDRGPVTECWDDDFQQATERRLQIQRFCERFAGLSQEGKALSVAMVFVDVRPPLLGSSACDED